MNLEQRATITRMKWNVIPDEDQPKVWAILVTDSGIVVALDLTLDEAQDIAAAHNAVLDMILEEFK